jgi:hypothetical protein
MDLKQYTTQKRRNPFLIIVFIVCTLFIIFLIYKNIKSSSESKQGNQPVQININTELHSFPDSIYPMLLLKDKMIMQSFNSKLPKDTTCYLPLSPGVHSFMLLDNGFRLIYSDSIMYKSQKVVFVHFK